MKFSLLFTPILLAATALGQATSIDLPKPGTPLHNEETFTFKVDRPASIMTSTEVGYAIGIVSCSSGSCPGPSDRFGRILYNGPFRPQRDRPGNPYQNFTLTIPPLDVFPKGLAQINTVRLHMIGAGPVPIFETNSVQIEVV